MNQKEYIVKKVSFTDTFRKIPKGKSVTFDCREVGLMSSAKAAVSRLNMLAGREEYKISTEDNGVTYTVTRN